MKSRRYFDNITTYQNVKGIIIFGPKIFMFASSAANELMWPIMLLWLKNTKNKTLFSV